ncbi:hypothetical protein GcM3_049027 [Golovinomyces cichoracearum]|uniref:Uncharacterized protein n=1 Tax=Golovinomyces cichoracearum TaxID=62708 RepID=A0A420IZU6_9PEZI|nr:hypothetical protein GcM3_049027 [Golovinomyces cichoracearum]
MKRSYLEEIELECADARIKFLALISECVSCLIRGEGLFLEAIQDKNSELFDAHNNNIPGVLKVISGKNSNSDNFLRGSTARPTPSGRQGHEDRGAMIRPNRDHETQKVEPFHLRRQMKRVIPYASPVADLYQIPSGVAIFVPMLTK